MKRLLLGPLVWCLLHHPLYGSSANIQQNPSFSWQQMSQNALQQSNKAVGIIYNLGQKDACFLFPRFDLLPQNIQTSEPEESSQVQKTFLDLGILPCDTDQDVEVQRLTKNHNEQNLRQREGLLRLNEDFDVTNVPLLTNGWPFVFKKNALSSMIQFRDESLDDSGPMMSNDKSAHDKWGPRSVIKRLLSSTVKELGISCFSGILIGAPVGIVFNLLNRRKIMGQTIVDLLGSSFVSAVGIDLQYKLLESELMLLLSPSSRDNIILRRVLSIWATSVVCGATTATAIIMLSDRES